MSGKHIILFQTHKPDHTRSASVFPGTKAGLDEAIKAVNKRYKAFILIVEEVPSMSEILNTCEIMIANRQGKMVQS